jgi:DNA-binding IclR family transcriptional regulator
VSAGGNAARRQSSVERALALLDELAAAGAPVGTNELARRLGVNASTTSRLLATLAAAGYVEREESSGRYRLGLHLAELADVALAGLDLRARARPRLAELARATQETATLSVPAGGQAITIDFVASPRHVISQAQVGRPSVAHATAVGKLMLAFSPLGDGVLVDPLERYTPATIVDREALRVVVDRARDEGWAEAEQEREDDLSAIAVPVFDHRGELAAMLGLQGPARFDAAARRAALPPLRAAAEMLSAALGGAGR